MAENEFSRLDPRAPLPQATVTRIGDGWNTPVGTAIRDESVTHLPLHSLPTAPSPVVVLRPTPTKPELRATLARCTAAMRSSNEALADAEANAERAAAHVEACRARLEGFASLDATITTATVIALRSGDGRPRGGMDEELRQLVRERDDARADLQAAESARRVLEADLAFARVDAEKAVTTARKAAVGVLGIEATALAERHDALITEAATIRERLAQFDRAVTNIGPLPALVLPVLHDPRNAVDLVRNVGAGEWRAKLDALLTDPA
jgi:hypothetical protein